MATYRTARKRIASAFADKLKADSIGNEQSAGINDWIDIGFFADADEEELIAYERVKINQKQKTLRFTLDEKPYKAAIDPRRILIERVVSDNVKTVENR